MNEINRIRDQFQRAFTGVPEAWHGPSLLQILEGLTAEKASAKPLVAAHSIWEIVLHITATHGLVLRRLRGDGSALTAEEDWPKEGAATKEAWQSTLAELKRTHSEVLDAIAGVEDPVLDEPILEGTSSRYVTLHGLVQHNLYHAGQIAILKKSCGFSRPQS